jgi:hypothetical protein
MKKILVLFMILGLVIGSVTTAEAGKKKKKKKKPKRVEREAQGTYQAPATAVGNCTQQDGVGCMTIQAGPKEKFLTAAVTDAHGQPVVINVTADTDGDMFTDANYGTFCGETEEPIEIGPGEAIIFWVGRAPDAIATACAPGIGTQGTLDVVFSNLP